MTNVPKQNVVIGWRCFHCGEYFRGDQRQAAADHFGTTLDATPACQIATADGDLVRALRDAHELVRRYQEEDTDLHRQIARLKCEHVQDLQNEEEKGYARGLRDGKALARQGERV